MIERLQSSRKERYAITTWTFSLTLTVYVHNVQNTLCSEFVSLLVLSSLLFFSVSFVCVCVCVFLGIQVLMWDCLYTNALFLLKAWVLFGGYVSGIWSHQCCKWLRGDSMLRTLHSDTKINILNPNLDVKMFIKGVQTYLESIFSVSFVPNKKMLWLALKTLKVWAE